MLLRVETVILARGRALRTLQDGLQQLVRQTEDGTLDAC